MNQQEVKQRREGRTQHLQDRVNLQTRKTATLASHVLHVRHLRDVYIGLWSEKSVKAIRREAFISKEKKLKTLLGYWGGIQDYAGPEETIIVAYGAAKFASNRRGCYGSAPTVAALKVAQDHFPGRVRLVDEFRTSALCCDCFDEICSDTKRDLTKKKKRKKKRKSKKKGWYGCYREVRGLRFCCSKTCARVPYKNRDAVGAKNILACYLGELNGERPEAFRRMDENGVRKPCVKTKVHHCVNEWKARGKKRTPSATSDIPFVEQLGKSDRARVNKEVWGSRVRRSRRELYIGEDGERYLM